DAKLRVQMRVEIRRLHNRLKATSVFVTHDQVEAMTLADMVVVMNAGSVEHKGGRVGFRAEAFACEVGQDVDVGVRPEDLTFTAPGAGDKLAFVKDFVEELGATRLIHGSVGEAPIVVAVATSTQLDDAGGLAVDPAAVHLFDMGTGASLRRGVA